MNPRKSLFILLLLWILSIVLLYLYFHRSNNIIDNASADSGRKDLRSNVYIAPTSAPEVDHTKDVIEKKMINDRDIITNNIPQTNLIHPEIILPNQFEKVETIKLHTVTYATHGGKDDRFCRAVESAIRHNFELIILGWGEKWLGLSQKLTGAYNYIKSLPPKDVILFTDAFDVLYTDEPDNILQKFLSAKTEILFSAECGCWPHVMEDRDACFNKYPKSPTPYRYLNSGTWIGYAKPAADMLLQIIKEAGNDFTNANDQKLVADFYINGRFGIKLDFYNLIFQSMHMTLDPPLPHCNPVEHVIKTPENKWKNKLTNSLPSVFHFNGGGKQHHLKMEKEMWYKKPENNDLIHKNNLADYIVLVPTNANGRLKFKDICPSYIR